MWGRLGAERRGGAEASQLERHSGVVGAADEEPEKSASYRVRRSRIVLADLAGDQNPSEVSDEPADHGGAPRSNAPRSGAEPT